MRITPARADGAVRSADRHPHLLPGIDLTIVHSVKTLEAAAIKGLCQAVRIRGLEFKTIRLWSVFPVHP